MNRLRFLFVWLMTFTLLIFLTFCKTGITYAAVLPCMGKMINPVTDICWDCLLPITIGSNSVVSGSFPDTDNPDSPLCSCGEYLNKRFGISFGYWEPMMLVDVTRSPYCLVSLGGVSVGEDPRGGAINTAGKDDASFFHVHVYNFPIMQWLGITPPQCHEEGTLNHLVMPTYLSELDPTWTDDALNMTLFPETSQLGDVVTQSACAADSLAANIGLPIEALFWCAGAQGSLYPTSGHVQEHVGGVQASVLIAERVMFKLHRLKLVRDSSASELCGETYRALIPKSRYRYQMTYPVATTKSQDGCHPFGRSTMGWEASYPGQELPTTTENYAYLIWRKRNCCAY
jgi:conjugal transfer pilus assembly protein TraU